MLSEIQCITDIGDDTETAVDLVTLDGSSEKSLAIYRISDGEKKLEALIAVQEDSGPGGFIAYKDSENSLYFRYPRNASGRFKATLTDFSAGHPGTQVVPMDLFCDF